MIGNILALTNSASASNENIEVDGLLKKGLYNGNASDLKSEIDKKVSQEAGKGLSSNDYTNEEKQKNEENALKRVANITVTGDVNKIITITFADSTVMQAPFKDNDHIPLADVHMNSLNFNENTGVLTGVKSDGNEISVSLDGRYSLIGHNHDEQYSPKTHTHSQYAYRTHRHNKDDIDGLPANIATTESIKTAIEEIQIGGRNYLINSAYYKTNLFYCGNNISASNDDNEQAVLFNVNTPNENWVRLYANPNNINYLANKVLTVSFDFKVKEGLLLIPEFYGGSFMGYKEIKPVNGSIVLNKWIRVYTTFVAEEIGWAIHLGFSKLKGKYLIKNFKIEIGNTPTDWSPAPEDFGNPVYYQNITNAHTFLNRNSSVHIGSGGNIVNAPSTHYYEMVGFTHNNLNWGFIIAKNIDEDDKSLYVKQVINGSYKDWFKIKENDPVGNIINGTRQILPNEADKVIFITNSIDNCALNVFPDKCSVSFIKVFDGGYVNFTCLGKNIIYSEGIRNFDGKKGSRATVSIFESDCYIDIRNV